MPAILTRALDKKLLNSGRLIVFEDNEHLFRVGLVLKVVRGSNSISELIILTSDNKTIEVKKVTTFEVHCILNKQIKGIDTNNVLQENESKSLNSNKKFATEDSGQKLDSLGLSTSINLLLFAVKNFITHEKLGKWDIDTMYQMQDYAKKFMKLAQSNYQCLKCVNFLEHFITFKKRFEVSEKISTMKYKMSSESLVLLPEYKQRIQVLQILKFLDEHLVLLPKGHIASCISDNELLITEIVFENLLGNLSDEAIPAILSCFISDKSNSDNDFSCDIAELNEVWFYYIFPIYSSINLFSF